MATVIRHTEESNIIKKYGKSPAILSGRLSENQLFEVLNLTSDKDMDITKIAADFQVGPEVLEKILRSVRAPEFQPESEAEKLQEEGQTLIKIAR